MTRQSKLAVPLLALLLAGASAPAGAGPLSSERFRSETGLKIGDSEVTSIWNALVKMGTTQFLGGSLGSLKLDESSMVAGAATIGASEFDNFLRTGGLGTAASGLGGLLSQRMTSGAGIDLSHLVGSFSGGGVPTGASANFSSLTSMGGASEASGMCDTDVGNKLASVGEERVNSLVNAAMSKEYGFSTVKDLTSGAGGQGSGFSALSCLDKLFQGSGTDILFKPPSLGNLTGMLQNWTCGQAMSVAQQVMNGAGISSDHFKTGSNGGFFPMTKMHEAMVDAPYSLKPGMSTGASAMFGEGFGTLSMPRAADIKKAAGLNDLFYVNSKQTREGRS